MHVLSKKCPSRSSLWWNKGKVSVCTCWLTEGCKIQAWTSVPGKSKKSCLHYRKRTRNASRRNPHSSEYKYPRDPSTWKAFWTKTTLTQHHRPSSSVAWSSSRRGGYSAKSWPSERPSCWWPSWEWQGNWRCPPDSSCSRPQSPLPNPAKRGFIEIRRNWGCTNLYYVAFVVRLLHSQQVCKDSKLDH